MNRPDAIAAWWRSRPTWALVLFAFSMGWGNRGTLTRLLGVESWVTPALSLLLLVAATAAILLAQPKRLPKERSRL